jgi:tetratricopeptide (TPR) repeat protein
MKRHLVAMSLALLAAVAGIPGGTAAQDDVDRRWLRQVDDPRALGLQLLREGNIVQAKEVLERALQNAPGDAAITDALAETYARLAAARTGERNTVEAAYFWQRVIDLKADDREAWLGLGVANVSEGNLDKAIEAFLEAERLGASASRDALVRTFTTRANKRVDLGLLPGAQQDLDEAFKRGPRDTEAHLVLGRLRLAENRPADAVAPLRTAKADPAMEASALTLLAVAYQNLERWLDSIRAATEAAEFPAVQRDALMVQSRSYYGWGLVAFRAEAWAAAEHRFFRAVELDPQWDDAQFSGALARIRQGKGREARAVLGPLELRRADYPGLRTAQAEAGHLIGRAELSEGRPAEAARTLREAFAYDERLVAILLSLGEAEEAAGRYGEAVAAFRDGLARGADPVAAHRGAARVLDDHLKQPLDALPHAESLLGLVAGDAEAIRRIRTITRAEGLAAHQGGNDVDAIGLLVRHRDFVKDDAEVNFALGRSFANQLRFAEALPLAEPLYVAKPGDAAYATLLFETRVGLGDEATLSADWVRAEEHYARALEVRPDSQDVRFRYGQALLALTKYPEAAAALRIVWAKAPALHGRTGRPLAEALAGWARQQVSAAPAEAVKLADEAVARDPSWPPSWRVRSEGHRALNNLDAAIPDAEAYLQRNDDLDARDWLQGLLREGAVDADRKGRHPVAEARARRLLELMPDDPEGTFRLGHAMFMQNRWTEARPLLEQSAVSGAYQAPATLDLARGFAKAGEPERAGEHYLTVRRLDASLGTQDEFVATWRAAAKVAASESRKDDVAVWYGHVAALLPGDPPASRDFGRALVAIERWAQAVPLLRTAWRAFPKDRDTSLDYARALIGTQEPLAATKILEPWEQPTAPGRAEAEALTGEAYVAAMKSAWTAADLANAEIYAERAARRLDRNPDPWYALGEIRFQRERWEEALKAFFRVYDLDPSYRETAFYLADIYVKIGDRYVAGRQYALARGAYDNSQKYAPSLEASYGQLVVAQAERRYADAVSWADRIDTERRGYKDVYERRLENLRLLAAAAIAAKDYGAAQELWARVVELEPRSPDGHYWIGLTLLEAGRPNEAAESLEKVRRLAGLDYEGTRALLIRAYEADVRRRLAAGDWYNVLSAVDRGLEIDPEQPELYLMRGEAQERLERWEAAIGTYRAGLKLSVQTPPAMRERLERLLAAHPEYAPGATAPTEGP